MVSPAESRRASWESIIAGGGEVRCSLSFSIEGGEAAVMLRRTPVEQAMSKSGSMRGPASFAPGLTASPSLGIVIAGLAIVIFVIDSMTDQGIAIAVFYVIVVFLGLLYSGARGVLLVAGGCMALTLLSYALWPRGPVAAGAIDTVISLVAIGATAYFALRIRDAEAAKQEARNQLARIGRLNTLGELAASIAHEVNQPLAGVASNADAGLLWLAKEPPNVLEANKALERIACDAVRAGAVIDGIRRLARKEPAQWASFDLNQSTLDIIAVTQSELHRNRISAGDLEPSGQCDRSNERRRGPAA
jgi:signal transduction histidine kinase